MKSIPDTPAPRPNWLLSALRPPAYDRITTLCDVVALHEHDVIWEPGAPIEHVYFPQSGCHSVISVLGPKQEVEVGTVGWEGMTGLSLLHGVRSAATRCIVQIAGSAMRMRANDFVEELTTHRDLLAVMHRYAQFWSEQSARSIGCNGVHTIDQRCARWLLMTADRVDSPVLPLRHEFLAIMLGVRRASVSVAAASLQSAGLIAYTRGKITILDRPGLIRAACGCYSAIKACYATLLPESGRKERQ